MRPRVIASIGGARPTRFSVVAHAAAVALGAQRPQRGEFRVQPQPTVGLVRRADGSIPDLVAEAIGTRVFRNDHAQQMELAAVCCVVEGPVFLATRMLPGFIPSDAFGRHVVELHADLQRQLDDYNAAIQPVDHGPAALTDWSENVARYLQAEADGDVGELDTAGRLDGRLAIAAAEHIMMTHHPKDL